MNSNIFNKKVTLILLVFLCFGFYQSKAQFLERSEIGLYLGGSNYMGDLNGMSPFGTISPAGGVIYRYTLNPRWVLKGNALYGGLKGGNPDAINDRNLSFQSYIFEASVQVEFNFLPYITGDRKMKWAPYIFAGASMFSFNPKGQYEGKWHDLQALGTEGQGTVQYSDREPYSLVQFAIPMGLGFKFSIAKNVSIGLEYGIRKTFTDYLDDVSLTYVGKDVLANEMSFIFSDRTNELPNKEGIYHAPGSERGNPELDDWYSFFGVTVTFNTGFLVPQKNCNQNNKFKYYESRKRYPIL